MIINIPNHLIEKSKELHEFLRETPYDSHEDVRSRVNAQINTFGDIGSYVHNKIQKKLRDEMERNGKE